MTEYEEQRKVVNWLRAKKIFHFAPTNENNTYKQNKKYAIIAEKKAKAVGKTKGVSDLVVFLDDKILFIEMKRARKRLKSGKLSNAKPTTSIEQIEFIERVNGYKYAEAKVCQGADEAIEFLSKNIR